MLKKWLREPLLHFLLIGGSLFLLYGLQDDEVAGAGNRIHITRADIDRLTALWEKTWQRPPTGAEVEGLIESHIREEVLYREALAMGLDRNDTIVRRRLAQKVEFISADLAAQTEPSETDLADYLAAHPEKFTVPGRVSFVQVFLSAERRGERVHEDGRRLLNELAEPDSQIDVTKAGDPFMLGERHDRLSEQEVARQFGKEFASSLFPLPVGSWQGPIPSGYGLHLVRLESSTPSRQPKLEEVREEVHREWLVQQRRKIDQAFYGELRKRYEITVEPTAGQAQALAEPAIR